MTTGAQGGAHVHPDNGAQDMSASHHLVVTIVSDHKVSQRDIARATNRTEGTISRILSGSMPIPAEMLAYLWQRTADGRIAEYLGLGGDGPGSVELIPVVARAGDAGRASDDLMQAMHATHSALTDAAASLLHGVDHEGLRLIDQAIGHLVTLGRSLRARDSVSRATRSADTCSPAPGTATTRETISAQRYTRPRDTRGSLVEVRG